MHIFDNRFLSPVWYVDVNDGSLVEFALVVCAGCEEKSLVVRQAVGTEELPAGLPQVTKGLAELRLFVLQRGQDVRR